MEVLGENVFSGCSDLNEIEISPNIIDIPEGLCEGCGRLNTVKFNTAPTSIRSYAFCNTGIENVDLGNRLESIGRCAFYHSSIDTKIPASVKTIETAAFQGSKITSLNLPNIEAIGDGAFASCSALAEVKLCNSLTRIGKAAFYDCINLNAIVLPESLISIEEYTFAQYLSYRPGIYNGITMLDIPDSVTEIGEEALPEGLTKLHIGKGIQSIARQKIATECAIICDALTPPALGDRRLDFTPQFVLVPEGAGQAYRDNNRWSDYRIIEKNGVKAVVHLSEPGTLASEIRMQSGQFPANVTNLVVTGQLNDDDFAIMRSNMTACYDIDLSKVTNTSIPGAAFANKSILSNIVLPEGTEIIGGSAFSSCKLLGIDHFPESLTRIGSKAFNGCISLSGDLMLPESLGEIGASAFNSCLNITSCNLETTLLTEIDESIFAGCSNLAEVRLPESITRIGTKAFSGSGIRSINLPESLSEIGYEAFKDCVKLSSIELPAGISSLGESVFAGAGLVWINIPESIAEIPEFAFSGCKNLMVVNFPASLLSIKTESFSGCTNMAAISSPAQEPATISTNGFSGIDNYSCSLSIPTTSFTKYLLAQYWGAFVDIRNNIEVAVDKAIDVTYIDEVDYQEMMEEESEGGAEAVRSKRSAALRVMREAGVVSAVKGYGRLFDGASLYVNEDASTRFFINTTDVPNLKVVYDGRDITSQIDRATNSFVIDGLLKPTLLKITGTPAGIEEVSDDSDTTSSVEYYDLNGLSVQGTLAPGIYIRRQGSHVSKIYVRN